MAFTGQVVIELKLMSHRIVCNTSLSVEDDFGPVVVTVGRFKGKSTQMFYYRVSI